MIRKHAVRAAMLLGALAMLALACGGDDATPTPAGRETPAATPTAGQTMPPGPETPIPSLTVVATDSPSVSTDGGYCRFTVTGDDAGTFEAGGGASAVGTDYWLTDDEMRDALRMMIEFGEELSEEELDRRVEEAMQEDPRFFLLLVNCTAEGASLSLYPSNPSKYADVPFGPKSYVIAAGGLLGGAENPGEFSVLVTVGETSYGVSEPGALEITKFDSSGIAGTFSFKIEEGFAEGTPKTGAIEGEFDFECVGGSVCD